MSLQHSSRASHVAWPCCLGADYTSFVWSRFQALDGQVSEFELRPSWSLPLQEVPEEWDINPATEDLPLDAVLAQADTARREHLAGWPVQPC